MNLEYKGEAIERGGDDKPNKNIYTGSVIKDKDGIYHAFYTAFNADIKINGKRDVYKRQIISMTPNSMNCI